MNVLDNKLFLFSICIFLSMSLYVKSMDLAIASVPEISGQIDVLKKQLADKEQQLKEFELRLGENLKKAEQEINGLRATHELCKKKWFDKEKDYQERVSSFEEYTKQFHERNDKLLNEKKEMEEIFYTLDPQERYFGAVGRYEEAANQYEQAVKTCKKYKDTYEQAIKMCSSTVVQWVQLRKSIYKGIYKGLFFGALSSFVLCFLWVQYRH